MRFGFLHSYCFKKLLKCQMFNCLQEHTHKYINKNLRILFPVRFLFYLAWMPFITLPSSFPIPFFLLKLELSFHYFCHYAKGDFGKKSFCNVLHHYFIVLTILKKDGFGGKFDCFLISEYNLALINFSWGSRWFF